MNALKSWPKLEPVEKAKIEYVVDGYDVYSICTRVDENTGEVKTFKNWVRDFATACRAQQWCDTMNGVSNGG